MIKVRKADDRGPSNLGWLQSRHTFSFGGYYDPEFMGFESLRVINDDRVRAGSGFGEHAHENMEIISYVLSGSLSHEDSMGNGSVIQAGDVQRMSAGTGVTHSEFNHAKEDVHFLQIWILPNEQGLPPGYEQKNFSTQSKQNTLKLVASQSGRDGSVSLNQDVDMYITRLDDRDSVEHRLADHKKAWVHIARGSVKLNGIELQAGDGAAIEGEYINLSNGIDSEVLIFDLATY